MLGQEGAHAPQELLPLANLLGVGFGLRVDQVEPEIAQVHAAGEARQLPLGLSALLGYLL